MAHNRHLSARVLELKVERPVECQYYVDLQSERSPAGRRVDPDTRPHTSIRQSGKDNGLDAYMIECFRFVLDFEVAEIVDSIFDQRRRHRISRLSGSVALRWLSHRQVGQYFREGSLVGIRQALLPGPRRNEPFAEESTLLYLVVPEEQTLVPLCLATIR